MTRRFHLLLAGYVLVLAVLAIPSLVGWGRTPLVVLPFEFDWFQGTNPFGLQTPVSRYVASVSAHAGLTALAGLLFALLVQAGRARLETGEQGWLWPSLLLISLPSLVTLPYLSCDVFIYIVKGWMDGVQDLDPFVHTYGQIAGIGQHPMGLNAHPHFSHIPGNYGPLFAAWSATLGRLAGDNLKLALVLYKLTTLGAWYGVAEVAGRLAQRHGVNRTECTFVLAGNPLAQFAFVAAAHNDALMLLPVLLGFVALADRRYFLAGGLVAMGFSIKYIPVLLLPALCLGALLREVRLARWRALGLVVLGFAVVAAGATLLYPTSLELFRKTVQSGYGYARSSIYVPLAIFLPDLTGLIRHGLMALFLLLLGLAGVRILSVGRDDHPQSAARWAAATLAFYLLFLSQMVGEWYLTWVVVWLAVDADERARRDALWVVCTLMPAAICTPRAPFLVQQVAMLLTMVLFIPALVRACLRVGPSLRPPLEPKQA